MTLAGLRTIKLAVNPSNKTISKSIMPNRN